MDYIAIVIRAKNLPMHRAHGCGLNINVSRTPVPAMPPGGGVGAKVPPMFTVIRSSSQSSRFGGALYNFRM